MAGRAGERRLGLRRDAGPRDVDAVDPARRARAGTARRSRTTSPSGAHCSSTASRSRLHQRLDNALDVQTARAQAQDALAAAARDADPQRAAQARTLLGILTFGASASGGSQDQVDAAVSDFTDAIRADPDDDFAKFDLELLLRLTAAHGTRTGPGQSNGQGATGRRGAGGGVPGSGY